MVNDQKSQHSMSQETSILSSSDASSTLEGRNVTAEATLQDELNTSECPSLGLGSSESNKQDDGATSTEGTTVVDEEQSEFPSDEVSSEHQAGNKKSSPFKAKKTEQLQKTPLSTVKHNQNDPVPREVSKSAFINHDAILSPLTFESFQLSNSFSSSDPLDQMGSEPIADLSPILAARESGAASVEMARSGGSEGNGVTGEDKSLSPSHASVNDGETDHCSDRSHREVITRDGVIGPSAESGNVPNSPVAGSPDTSNREKSATESFVAESADLKKSEATSVASPNSDVIGSAVENGNERISFVAGSPEASDCEKSATESFASESADLKKNEVSSVDSPSNSISTNNDGGMLSGAEVLSEQHVKPTTSKTPELSPSRQLLNGNDRETSSPERSEADSFDVHNSITEIQSLAESKDGQGTGMDDEENERDSIPTSQSDSLIANVERATDVETVRAANAMEKVPTSTEDQDTSIDVATEEVSSENQEGARAEEQGTLLDSVSTENQQADSMVAEASLQVNESSSESLTSRDLDSAKKHLGASSLAFIERLRGAAQRRKQQVARSRDSLAAKEREQLLSIASAKERQREAASNSSANVNKSLRPTATIGPYKPFKARPMPSTTGPLGSGGQAGVPKVAKKPSTTPFSPLLGARRPETEKIPALAAPPPSSRRSSTRFTKQARTSLQPKKPQDQIVPFKARPAPPTTGMHGHGGQAGVPKVAKRAVTVPVSPCLGMKRNSLAGARLGGKKLGDTKQGDSISEVSGAKENVHRERIPGQASGTVSAKGFRPRQLLNSVMRNSSNSFSTTASSPLQGLNFLSTPSSIGSVPQSVTTPTTRHSAIVAYTPHSTVRAKKRAEFDKRREEHEIERQEEERKARKSLIKEKRTEISRLKHSLR